MKTVICSDLFDDEVAEILRSAPDAVIRRDCVVWEPSHMLNDDGIYSDGTGYYTEYIHGRRSAVVPLRFLIHSLAHTEFSMEV